jgi:hypothetical protein
MKILFVFFCSLFIDKNWSFSKTTRTAILNAPTVQRTDSFLPTFDLTLYTQLCVQTHTKYQEKLRKTKCIIFLTQNNSSYLTTTTTKLTTNNQMKKKKIQTSGQSIYTHTYTQKSFHIVKL